MELLLRGLSLHVTLHSGQAFRWQRLEGELYAGIVGSRCALLRQQGDDVLVTCAEVDAGFWLEYFDEDRDWAALADRHRDDPLVGPSMSASAGLRVLHQPLWETVVAFILSQNNNDARIRTCVARLSQAFGVSCAAYGTLLYDVPTPDAVHAAGEDALRRLGMGYRAAYLADAARWAMDGGMERARAASYDGARAELMTIKGVGPKVADCIALFGLGHTQAFPVDVWIGRVVGPHFPGVPKAKLPEAAVARWGEDSGLVQQAIFYAARPAKPSHQPNQGKRPPASNVDQVQMVTEKMGRDASC